MIYDGTISFVDGELIIKAAKGRARDGTMIYDALLKYRESIHLPPETTLRAEVKALLPSNLVRPLGMLATESSFRIRLQSAGTAKVNTFAMTMEQTRGIAALAARAITEASSESLTYNEAVDFLFVKLQAYRTAFPESYDYDMGLSFAQWRDRLGVHVEKLATAKRGSKRVRILASLGTMALAWLWALNNKVGWAATPARADVEALKQQFRADFIQIPIPKVPLGEWKVESPAKLCDLCFRPAAFVQSDFSEHLSTHSLFICWLCEDHHAAHPGSINWHPTTRHWCELVSNEAALRHRLQRYEGKPPVAAVMGTSPLNALAQQIEDQIKGSTVVKQAPLNPGYRWLRPWRENTSDIKCLVEYCNAVALVRVVNRKPGVESATKYVCSQHLAQGIMLGAEATVTTL